MGFALGLFVVDEIVVEAIDAVFCHLSDHACVNDDVVCLKWIWRLSVALGLEFGGNSFGVGDVGLASEGDDEVSWHNNRLLVMR